MSEAAATGVIIVDHGSKRAESNAMLEQFVAAFAAEAGAQRGDRGNRDDRGYVTVEAAHMELAEPTIGQAFDRCVAAGAKRVIVMPYFLLPGRHWRHDIPSLTAEAAAKHPGVEHLVTAPIGLHPLMAEVIASRIDHCERHATGDAGPCDVCEGTEEGCRLRSHEP